MTLRLNYQVKHSIAMPLWESSQAADHEIKWGLCHEAQIDQAFSKAGVVYTYDRSEDLCCNIFFLRSIE